MKHTTVRPATEIEIQVMEYLNILRDSGATNMFGATPYIIEEFNLPTSEASRILSLWMNNYNGLGKYNTVNI